MSEDPFLEMQVKLAFFENTVADLDGVVRQLFSRIEELEKELSELRSTLGKEQVEGGLIENRPPHY